MYNSKLIILLFCSLMHFSNLKSQTRPKNTLGESIIQLDTAIKQIGGLFKKKDKTTEKKKATESVQTSPGNNDKGGPEPGDISPDAKYIDFEYADPFYNGVAVVRKGTASALIDKNGNFIIPYNKFTVTYADEVNGFISISNEFGYTSTINTTGKILYDYKEPQSINWGSEGKGSCIEITYNNKKTFMYTDTSGKRYVHTEKLIDIQEGIGIVGIVLTDMSTIKKYKTLQGKFINNDSYDEANGFSDGMALVGKRDEFGEMKYGYINTKGEQVIPCKYSEKPSKFKNGFAMVKPKDKSDMQFGFINKKGELVIKKTYQEYQKIGEPGLFYKAGLSIAGRYVMDTSGNLTLQDQYLSSYGIKTTNVGILRYKKVENEDKNIIWYSAKDPVSGISGYGFINVEKKTATRPIFHDAVCPIHFDPVAKLSFVRMQIGTDANKNDIWREGFINEDGIFVLLKSKGDKW